MKDKVGSKSHSKSDSRVKAAKGKGKKGNIGAYRCRCRSGYTGTHCQVGKLFNMCKHVFYVSIVRASYCMYPSDGICEEVIPYKVLSTVNLFSMCFLPSTLFHGH